MEKCIEIPTKHDYEYFENRAESYLKRRCIDGNITNSANCVGYCTYYGHNGFLTKQNRKVHDCIGKGCVHYVPKKKGGKTQRTNNETMKREFALIKEVLDEFEGMRALHVKKEKRWIVKYITITNAYPISEIEYKLSNVIGDEVELIRLDYDFDRAAYLIFQ